MEKDAKYYAEYIREYPDADINWATEQINEYAAVVARDAEAKVRAGYDSKYAALVKATEEFLKDAEANNLPEPECKCTACRAIPRFKAALAALKHPKEEK